MKTNYGKLKDLKLVKRIINAEKAEFKKMKELIKADYFKNLPSSAFATPIKDEKGNVLMYKFQEAGPNWNDWSPDPEKKTKYLDFNLLHSLKETLQYFAEKYPDDVIGIGDLNGKTSDSKKFAPLPYLQFLYRHGTGNTADIGLPRQSGGYSAGSYNDPHYSREKTIELIEKMISSAPAGKRYTVKFNDPKVREYFEQKFQMTGDLKYKRLITADSQGNTTHNNHVHFELEAVK